MKRGRDWIWRALPPMVVLVAALLAAEAYVRCSGVRSYLVPKPSAVLKSLVQDGAELYPALAQTTAAALIGFAVSAVVGVLIAVLLSTSKLLRRAVYPYTVFFQTVPLVAIAPLLIFVLEPGLISVSLCAVVVSIFPVIANTMTGLLSTDPALVDLFRLYRAGAVAQFWKLRLPAALPGIFTGLRVAAGLSVIGTVVAELLVGSLGEHAGLGVRIVSSIKYGRVDRVFAAVLLSSLLGLVLFGAVNAAARLSLRRWHASEQE